jgi:hypothetical protein
MGMIFVIAKKAHKKSSRNRVSGKLRIGDDWNAINIIALSQTNPLKAVAEFVENSIDARARNITITRGREHGESYLRIVDDGDGIPRDDEGRPNFRYVATHICDSIKRQLKADGAHGIQGEFGIGLLSFWTVGEGLILTSTGADGKTYQMRMKKGSPNYTLKQSRALFPEIGATLLIKPLLAGIRQLTGEKMQWYLAAELRDRIRHSGVQINIIDRTARKEYKVEPRQFSGRLLHELPAAATVDGEIYLELYLAEPGPDCRVGLYRMGTRVLVDLMELDEFQREPWSSGCLQGIVDAPFLNLTPGTRSGIIRDARFERLCLALKKAEAMLLQIIVEQRRAEDERASHKMLTTIRKAFQEALMVLPAEEYDWFDIQTGNRGRPLQSTADPQGVAAEAVDEGSLPGGETHRRQKQFFEYAGPLFSVRVSPQSSVVPVNQAKTYRAVARDRSRILVEHDLGFQWRIVEGAGALDNDQSEIVTFNAPDQPGLSRIAVKVTQGANECEGEGIITVTDSILPEMRKPTQNRQGLPGYTFHKAAGELWRSKYDAELNVIVINNGHRDFVYASKNKSLKTRYICRLFAKEMVQKNFPGYSPDQLLERMIELSLYTEENLR